MLEQRFEQRQEPAQVCKCVICRDELRYHEHEHVGVFVRPKPRRARVKFVCAACCAAVEAAVRKLERSR
jgi:hypothetical protein